MISPVTEEEPGGLCSLTVRAIIRFAKLHMHHNVRHVGTI